MHEAVLAGHTTPVGFSPPEKPVDLSTRKGLMMISLVVSAALCTAVGGVSIGVAIGCLRKLDLFQDSCESLVIGLVSVFLSINALLGLVSLVPVDHPLRSLLIPIQIALLLCIVFFVGWRECVAAVTENSIRLVATVRSMPLSLKVASVILLSLVVLYGLVGALTVPFGVDELAYHAPQAIGVFQDGRIRSFWSQAPWLFFYPQGAANLWAWTMFFTGNTILFRAVQLVFGVQLLLAIWLLARRGGASEAAATLAVFIVAGTALFYIVVTTCNDDIGNAAAIVTMLAFFAPPQLDKTDNLQRDLAGACLALSEACLIKVPFVAGLFALVGLAGCTWTRAGSSYWRQYMLGILTKPVTWVMCGVLVLSCYTYILNAFSAGNPIYPFAIGIGRHVIFSGDLAPQNVGPGTSPFSNGMSIPVRWTKVFSDWYAPVTTDSLGTAGLVYPIVVLFLAFVAILDGLRRQNRWIIVLAVLALSMFVVPKAWVPRYGIPWLSVWAVLASFSFTAALNVMGSLASAIVMIVGFSSFPQIQNAHDLYLWLKSNSPPLAWYQDRGRSVPEHYDLDRSLAPSAAMVHAIRVNAGAGTVLAWCVNAYPYLLWNLTFSNTIEYLDECDPCPPCGSPNGHDDDVYRSIARVTPDWLLLYSSSALSHRLIDHPLLHYAPVYVDRQTGSPTDRFNMTLFRRTATRSHTDQLMGQHGH